MLQADCLSFLAELTSDSQATSIQNKMRGHKVPVRETGRRHVFIVNENDFSLTGHLCVKGGSRKALCSTVTHSTQTQAMEKWQRRTGRDSTRMTRGWETRSDR